MASCNPKHLIVLVGHNPMPLYISVAALQPGIVHWVYSGDTMECKEDLIKVIKKNWPGITHEDKYHLDDPHSPRAVQETMSRLPQGAFLNYTGGTKVMTVHAHKYWMEHLDGNPDRSLYVDGKNGFFRFDTGEDLNIAQFTVSISVDDVISIHGLDKQEGKTKATETAGIKPEHYTTMARWSVDCPAPEKNIKELYKRCQQMRKKPGDAMHKPVDLSSILEQYLPGFASTKNWPVGNSKKTVEAWGKFFTGGWLEDFMEELVNNISQEYGLNLNVAGGVKPESRELVKNKDSELDLLAVRDYHIYLVSCTTSTSEGLIKGKCYEALNRVELVGGGLAKAAVVCLAAPEKALQAEKKARIGWKGDEGTVKVFNREDIRCWLDGNFGSLLRWFDIENA